jgi:transcription elongation factor GreA
MSQHYTSEALAALDAEIEEAERRHNEALLSMGDDSSHETWHDNPAFDQAKQDVDMTGTTFRRLRRLREEAVVIEREATHIVEVGSTVRVRIDGDDELMTVHLAGRFVAGRTDGDDVFMLGTASPLGAALLGKVEGDRVTYTTPTQQTMSATILELVS